MNDLKYAVDYQRIDCDGEGPWEEDGRFATLEEALRHAADEALTATNVHHRVVKIRIETVVTLPPLREK